jgi:hypothetical protein
LSKSFSAFGAGTDPNSLVHIDAFFPTHSNPEFILFYAACLEVSFPFISLAEACSPGPCGPLRRLRAQQDVRCGRGPEDATRAAATKTPEFRRKSRGDSFASRRIGRLRTAQSWECPRDSQSSECGCLEDLIRLQRSDHPFFGRYNRPRRWLRFKRNLLQGRYPRHSQRPAHEGERARRAARVRVVDNEERF